MTNIHFIGGIHGVGKGTLCRQIQKETNLIHLTASELIKWSEISDVDNKKVNDFELSQKRLINGLKQVIKSTNEYILDGHFCLFNRDGNPEKIAESTFRIINPKSISIVTETPQKICERLMNRDGKSYDVDILDKMQNMEIEYAKYLSRCLGVGYIEIPNSDYTKFLKYINQ